VCPIRVKLFSWKPTTVARPSRIPRAPRAAREGRKSYLTSGIMERYADNRHNIALWDNLALILTFIGSQG
jgi:hypothetical protein